MTESAQLLFKDADGADRLLNVERLNMPPDQ
jgi:hypothetical protein